MEGVEVEVAGGTEQEAVSVAMSIALTLISGCSTGLGGVIAAFFGSPDERMVGQMQAFAGGVMLFLSLFDLMPEATHVLGLPLAAIGFTSGALVFWAIVRLVPDPSQPFSNALAAYISQGAKPAASAASASPCPSLSQPRLLALARPSLVRRTSNEHADEDSAAIGSDPEAAQEAEPGLQAPAQGVVGVGAGGATGEDDDRGEKEAKEEKERRMVFFRTAFITALGISIHNFPEGVALYLSTMKGLSFGAGLAVTISLHNIPEGLAVAVPIAYTTRSRFWTIAIPFLTGLFEPLGAIAAGLFLHPFITDQRLHFLLAMVAGIMSFISANELLPVAAKHCGATATALATGMGMFVCRVFLFAAAMLPAM